jgi:hypothetical protein
MSELTLDKIDAMMRVLQRPPEPSVLYLNRTVLNRTKFLEHLIRLETTPKFRKRLMNRQLKRTKWEHAKRFNDYDRDEIGGTKVYLSEVIPSDEILLIDPKHLTVGFPGIREVNL